jgi:hypothetical protein
MKINSNYTVDTCFAELDQIRTSFKKANKGFRAEKYSMLERSQRIIARLLRNDNLRNNFIGRIRKKQTAKSKKLSTEKFDLSLEVAVKASGQSRKLAQKYARSLDYLRELNILVDDTIKVIKAKGGIEATYKEYRKYQAEKSRGIVGDSTAPKSLQKPKAKAPTGRSGNDKKGANKKEAGGLRPSSETSTRKRKPIIPVARNNDRLVEMKIRIKLSDRDQIIESNTGTEFTLSSVRVHEDDGALQIRRVTADADADDDWED